MVLSLVILFSLIKQAPTCTVNTLKISDCSGDNFADKPYYFGVGKDNQKIQLCNSTTTTLQPISECIDASTNVTYTKPCSELNAENLKPKTQCKQTESGHFCEFECNTGYFANPYLNYKKHDSRQKGMVACFNQTWITKNLCLPKCGEKESPFADKCVCEAGKGVDSSKNNTCQTCLQNQFSNGFKECKVCDKTNEDPNTVKKLCEMKALTNNKCFYKNFDATNKLGNIKSKLLTLVGKINCPSSTKLLSNIKNYVCYDNGDLSANIICSKDCKESINNTKEISSLKVEFGSSQNFTCNDGFNLRSNATKNKFNAKCDLGGVWTYQDECAQSCPVKELEIEHGKISDKQANQERAFEITFSCNEKYKTKKDGKTENITATCKADGTWDVDPCSEKTGFPVWAIVLIAIIGSVALIAVLVIVYKKFVKKDGAGL